MTIERRPENCPFYPGCYWAGDCGLDNWQTSNCGLPKAEQAKAHAKWMADIALRNARYKLAQRLKSEVMRGLHDDKLPWQVHP